MYKKQLIFITAPTGFIIRNLILGKFLDEIENNVDLIISTKNPNELKKVDKINKDSIHVIEYYSFNSKPKRTLKKILSIHYIFYLISVGAKNNQSIKNYVKIYDSKKNKILKFYKIILINLGKLLFKLNLLKYLVSLYEFSYSNHPLVKKWGDVFSKYKPDLVVTTILSLSHADNPSTDLPVVLAAKKNKIPVVTIIQSWDNLSTKPTIFPNKIHKYYVWSKIQEKELLNFYPWIKKSSIEIIGALQFDYHRDGKLIMDRSEFLRLLGIPLNSRYILFTTGMPKTLPNEIDELIILIKKLSILFPDLYFLIRIHPKDNSGRIEKYKNDLLKMNVIIQYSYIGLHMDEGGFSMPDEFFKIMINSIRHSEVVINSSSTITVDAAIINKPIICIAYNYIYDPVFPNGRSLELSQNIHYKRLVDTGGVSVAYSEDQLLQYLKKYMNDTSYNEEKRKLIVEMVTDPNIINAGKKLAGSIKNILCLLNSNP